MVILFLVLTSNMFFISYLHFYGEPTTLIINLFQDANQFFSLAFAQHGIFHNEIQLSVLVKIYICMFEQIVLHRRIFPQFQQNAVTVDFHQLLRCVLRRQLKTLVEFNDHGGIREKLLLDFSFHPENILFLYQPFRRNINAQKVLPLRRRNLIHRHLLI